MAVDPMIKAVAALDDELRRGMFTFIRAARRPVTRDEAATAVGISRTPKAYRPVDTDIRVAIPPRSPELLAELLLRVVLTCGEHENATAATMRVARERGREIGATERERARPGRLGAERALTLVVEILRRQGFEPDRTSRRPCGCAPVRSIHWPPGHPRRSAD